MKIHAIVSPNLSTTRNDEPEHMVEGHTFTIEPILTIGTTECVTWPDNWTTLTADGGVAAQFEHTILITRTVLTL
ncbi:BnaCnng33020D, partial [Brassica napus]